MGRSTVLQSGRVIRLAPRPRRRNPLYKLQMLWRRHRGASA